MPNASSEAMPTTCLVEVAWEVCNQVGGIYTVIRSKAAEMVSQFGADYCLVGPYIHSEVMAEFEPVEDSDDIFAVATAHMVKEGFEVYYGRWLVAGRPKVVLLNPACVKNKLAEIKYFIWENHQISLPEQNALIDEVVAFGHLIKVFLTHLDKANKKKSKLSLVAHFHEWMAGTPVADIKKNLKNVKTVFTTHATILGRYLAMNSPDFYNHMPFFDWEVEAKRFGIDAEVRFERIAAHAADVFTTVSKVTAKECEHLVGRKPDQILPNGLSIRKFEIRHEIQNLHQQYKEEIHEFVMGHFFQSYSFNLDRTLYFFTSGRYEFRNKGFDLTLSALKKLNAKMKAEKVDMTVVTFIVTNRPCYSINPETLQSRGVMEEIRQTCDAIIKQVRDKLFYSTAASADYRLPPLNDFVDDYWRLRLRRSVQSWKNHELPKVVTHDLKEQEQDEVLQSFQKLGMINKPQDPVKVVYHPEFIAPTNPLFGIEYSQFVRGCHLGIFPSYYEPWGYTPLECIASGVPAVTSDLCGFGDFVLRNLPNHETAGIHVVRRGQQSDELASDQLADYLYDMVTSSRRERIAQRHEVERIAENFSWRHLIRHYLEAYQVIGAEVNI
ncbi:MAG: glycosyltransferase [Cyclobacteriaceae bacterium]